MRNFLECRNGLIHADCESGDDHTLCGLTTEKTISSMADYAPEDEIEILPHLVITDKKVTCPQCAAIIRWCCHLGTKSIGKVKDLNNDED